MLATTEGLHERLAELRSENGDEHKELRAAVEDIRGLVADNKASIAVLQVKAGLVGLVGGAIPAGAAVVYLLLSSG